MWPTATRALNQSFGIANFSYSNIKQLQMKPRSHSTKQQQLNTILTQRSYRLQVY